MMPSFFKMEPFTEHSEANFWKAGAQSTWILAPFSGIKSITAATTVSLRQSVTFFPPKAGLVWKFFPEGAQKIQTVLKPKAEGQSGFLGS